MSEHPLDINAAGKELEALIDTASIDKAISVDIRSDSGSVRLRIEQRISKRNVCSLFRINGAIVRKKGAIYALAVHIRLLRDANKNGSP